TATNNSDFQRRLQQVRADKNELNKQVFGLLITNSFLPQDLTTFNAVGTTTSNTINDFVSSQLTTYFQNVLNDFLKNTEIDIGYDNIQSGSYNYTNEQGKQIDIKLEQEINDNIIVKIGTTYYDFANGAQGSANNLAGDFEVEYIITPDGRVRVKAFRLSEYDAIIAKNDVKTGVGIYYTKDFNKVRELLPWNKK
ncbi:MAG: translocation/assembly module TamB domain-containing protein, partial [Chitinophagales bacterium]